MPRTKAAPKPTCKHCGRDVTPIEGKILMRGNAASWRHAETALGCRRGDPLMDKDIRNLPPKEDE